MENYDFEFTDKDFNFIKNLVTDQTGIAVLDHKKNMIYGRLTKRLRALKLKNFKDYCDFIQQDKSEFLECINAITTNLTFFFRENHHFELLKDYIFPILLEKNQDIKEINIWCSASSTGEEPYSIAFTAFYNIPSNWKVNILASDIDDNVLAKAETAIYTMEDIKKLDLETKKKMFLKNKKDKNKVMVLPDLKKMITFKKINLQHEWMFKKKFDIIFCRNTLIYFDKERQGKIFEKFHQNLNDDSFLIIGHSETIPDKYKFKLLSKSAYTKLN